jgi:hypothetical protein
MLLPTHTTSASPVVSFIRVVVGTLLSGGIGKAIVLILSLTADGGRQGHAGGKFRGIDRDDFFPKSLKVNCGTQTTKSWRVNCGSTRLFDKACACI